MPSNPPNIVLYCIAILSGCVITAIFVWLFGIEVSEFEKLKNFPDGWTTLELVWNATAALILVGSIRAVYVALRAHYYGEPDDN